MPWSSLTLQTLLSTDLTACTHFTDILSREKKQMTGMMTVNMKAGITDMRMERLFSLKGEKDTKGGLHV